MQRGGAAQIDFLAAQIVRLLFINRLKIGSQARSYSCIHTKREAPFLYGEEGATLCSGEGLCRFVCKIKILNQITSHVVYTYTKREAPFLYGEEGATLCSGEGLCSFFTKKIEK